MNTCCFSTSCDSGAVDCWAQGKMEKKENCVIRHIPIEWTTSIVIHFYYLLSQGVSSVKHSYSRLDSNLTVSNKTQNRVSM